MRLPFSRATESAVISPKEMSLFGGAFAVAGSILLSVALWLKLVETLSQPVASLIVFPIILVATVVILLVARRAGPGMIAAEPRNSIPLGPVLEAFLDGLNAGKQRRR
ncbi:MAG: hypothetical protein ABI832_08410 [bacterium]